MCEGVVPAKGKLVLRIRFQPQIVGEHSTDYFTITSAGSHLETVLKVVGSCKGTKAFLFLPVSFLPLEGKRLVLREGLEIIISLWSQTKPLLGSWLSLVYLLVFKLS